ncbi:pyridoxamine 5'-phosphate oxidase family protein [Micropruina sp.]|uniref:pyridoxamine 5'-phosphate oxidase family protein n=1 Tax=Micropruina sp. TaxID=2737536 RepID=UPI0039E553B7
MALHSPIVALTADEAWQLLGTVSVGRLATAVGGQPDIFPVNFVVHDGSIVFRTAEGSKLVQVILNAAVAFEADSWSGGTGWSVVVKGTAHEVTGSDELAELERLPLRPWVPTVKTHVIAVVADEITGRRFAFGEEPEAEPEYTS